MPQSITVTEPAALSASSANGSASCDGGNDGTIVVNATGGNSSYTYSIDGINFQSSNQFNVAPGNYTVTVKDNLGCTTSFPTTVTLSDNLTFTKQTDPVICESKSVQLNFASNATQYAWSPATALSSTTVSNPVANPVTTTQYIVTATLGRCSVEDTVLVNVNAAPIPNAGTDGFICYGQTYQLSANGGTQYKWTPSTYLDNANIRTPVSTPIKDVVYTLSIVSDVNGCASLVTDSIRIDVTPPIKIRTFPFDTVVYELDTLPILAIASDTDVINYNWSPAFGLNNPNIRNPIVTAGSLNPATGSGTFGNETLYQVIGTTIAGCKGEGYVKIRIYKGPDLYVPNGFTPNGDGKNDRLIPFPVGIKELRYFRVYNRYGQLVFSTTKLNDGWDGTLSGIAQQTASFVWMAEAITETDKVITKKGVVTLIR
jgi:gliding motility-associated-like protein